MTVARDVLGTVFQNSSAVFLARIENVQGVPLTQASLQAAGYSIWALVPDEPNAPVAVAGQANVPLSVEEVIFNTLQNDAAWTVDEVGYNFRHELDVSEHEAFTEVWRTYQVRYELLPVTGQKIVLRFQVRCI
jgi:hypothetical protein